jgi:hypothetical protein
MRKQQVQQTQPEERMQAIQATWPFRQEFSLYLRGKHREQRKYGFSWKAPKASVHAKS